VWQLIGEPFAAPTLRVCRAQTLSMDGETPPRRIIS